MIQFTRVLLAALGISAVMIGLMIFLLGPHSTANIFGALINMISGHNGYSGGLEHVNIDSEMRFFSAFWMAYGVGLLWLVKNWQKASFWVYPAIGMFFMGGLGRLLSFIFVGAPDPLFTTLLVIELVGSIIRGKRFLDWPTRFVTPLTTPPPSPRYPPH